MFTGLITDIGIITTITRQTSGVKLGVKCPDGFLSDIEIGESIAVSGTCLTVVSVSETEFLTDISSESMDRTTIVRWRNGTKVNLEKSLRPDNRLGGHFVMGHVDGTARISRIDKLRR